MKKFLSIIAGFAIAIPSIAMPKAQAVNFTLKNQLQSESVVLINTDTDSVVHEKNPDTKQMPGPLVNIMVAVVVLENCENFEEEITIDPEVYSDLNQIEDYDDLRFIDLVGGDVLNVTDLLYAMMLTSSMEASSMLAYHFGDGSINKFVTLMNSKAEELGLNSTHFTNPTGVYDSNQYTTAHDMAVLTQYALTIPKFETISTTLTYNPAVPNVVNHENHAEWIFKHSNPMLDPDDAKYYYSNARGIKTANLEKGGRNIITMASRDGNNYLAVLMKSPLNDPMGNPTYYHAEDAIALFDWAFEHISYQVLLADTAELGELPVSLAEGNDYVLAKPKEEFSLLWYDDIDISVINKSDIKWYKKSLQAPVKKGEPLGQVTLRYNGEELGTVELVAVSDVKRSASKYNWYVAKMFKKSKWFKKAITISVSLCFIYALVCLYSFLISKSKSKPLKPKYAVPKVSNGKKKKK